MFVRLPIFQLIFATGREVMLCVFEAGKSAEGVEGEEGEGREEGEESG